MKLAVVINAESGPDALKHALHTQQLLLERLGPRLDSIRLAAPRLLRHACASALEERPDALAIVGGPRSARQAGQLAHEKGVPILFLPGYRSPNWATRLWGSLSLEDMIDRLARDELAPARLDAGAAGDRIFFERAECGLLAHVVELRRAFGETENFSEDLRVMSRAGRLARHLLHPSIHFHTDESLLNRAMALTIATKDNLACGKDWRRPLQPVFGCTAFRYGPFGYLGALARGAVGAEWRRSDRAQHFECKALVLDLKAPTWLLLDEEPILFEQPVEFRFMPAAIQTFTFEPAQKTANDNAKARSAGFGAVAELWNFSVSSHVAVVESRKRGDTRNRKQV